MLNGITKRSLFGIYIALYKPQIPPNTGNIARLCVAIQTPLLIVGMPAFDVSSPAAKRAGLDHWNDLSFLHFASFKKFYREFFQSMHSRIVPISKEGKTDLWDFKFQKNDILLFGNETQGLPPTIMSLFPNSIRIPMWGNVRSLNLSNSVSIVAYEAIRQQYHKQKFPEIFPNRTYYKNANHL